MPGKINYIDEFTKRGLTVRQACMAIEAIYSCAIEGAKKPTTKEELDRLVEMIKNERT